MLPPRSIPTARRCAMATPPLTGSPAGLCVVAEAEETAQRPGEPVLRGGLASEEAAARAINAQPWEPLPGMVKQQCPACRYFFAAQAAAPSLLCPDRAGVGTRPAGLRTVREPAPSARVSGGPRQHLVDRQGRVVLLLDLTRDEPRRDQTRQYESEGFGGLVVGEFCRHPIQERVPGLLKPVDLTAIELHFVWHELALPRRHDPVGPQAAAVLRSTSTWQRSIGREELSPSTGAAIYAG
jgi:hypothetical protein